MKSGDRNWLEAKHSDGKKFIISTEESGKDCLRKAMAEYDEETK